MKNSKNTNPDLCPCESGQTFKSCCQPYVEQKQDAATAQALMRSRYTAFVLQNQDYLRYSWHPENCPVEIRLNTETRWLGLSIKNTVAGDINDENGQVEFVARSKNRGKAHRLHENSRFCRYHKRWVYVDGEILD